MKARARVIISGKVQGVFFRISLRSQAKLREVVGWAKNLESGQVEAVFEGDKDRVESLIEYCREGPPNSSVGDVSVSWEDYSGDLAGFEIR